MSRAVCVVTTIIVLGALAGGTWAQHHGAHGSSPGADLPPHRQMQAALDQIDRVIAQGLGAGMAFAADQNGYPGPRHVLELKERLRLTPAQEARITMLETAMFAESRPKSERLRDAEARLRQLFADGVADAGRVRLAVAEVERTRAELRLVHLLTHLETRAVLTEEQRRAYHDARWGPPPRP